MWLAQVLTLPHTAGRSMSPMPKIQYHGSKVEWQACEQTSSIAKGVAGLRGEARHAQTINLKLKKNAVKLEKKVRWVRRPQQQPSALPCGPGIITWPPGQALG